MKKIILGAMSIFLTAGINVTVLADDAMPAASMAPADQSMPAGQNMPADQTMAMPSSHVMSSMSCKNISMACQAAGFSKMGSQGKRSWKDCMKPILLGQTVSGVTVNPDDIQTCKQKVAAKMSKNAAEMSAPMATPPSNNPSMPNQ